MLWLLCGISVYVWVPRQRGCCRTARRKKRTGKAWPVLCALTSTSALTSVGRVATLSVSRVFAPLPTTDPWTLPAHCAGPWSHTPTSTKVSVRKKWDFLQSYLMLDLMLNRALKFHINEVIHKNTLFLFIFRARPNGSNILPQGVLRPQAEL